MNRPMGLAQLFSQCQKQPSQITETAILQESHEWAKLLGAQTMFLSPAQPDTSTEEDAHVPGACRELGTQRVGEIVGIVSGHRMAD